MGSFRSAELIILFRYKHKKDKSFEKKIYRAFIYRCGKEKN